MSRKQIIVRLSERHRQILDRVVERIAGTRNSAIRFLLQQWDEKNNTALEQKD